MPRKKTEITTVNDSQLSVFNYSDIAQKYNQETANELESIEHEIIGIATNARIKIGEKLTVAKNLISHGDFGNWCQAKFQLAPQRISEYLDIAKVSSIFPESGNLFPEKLRSASTMAKAILKTSEEQRPQLIEEIKAKKEEKGKDLTEAQIKEIASKYEETIKQLKTELEDKQKEVQEAKQGELFFQGKLDEKVQENNRLIYTIENQNKQIKELNSDISSKENALSSLETQRADLDLLQQELEERIAKEANVIVQQTLEQERKVLAKKEADLSTKQQELEKQLKEAKAIKNKATKEKDNLTNVSDWILSLNDFNEVLKQQKSHVLATLRKIQEVPNLDVLEQSDKEIVNKKIDSVISDFHDNTEAFGMALNKVHLAIKKFDNTVLKTLGVARGKTVEVEVLNDE